MNNSRSCAKREIYEQFQSFVNGATVSVKVRQFGSLSAVQQAERSKEIFSAVTYVLASAGPCSHNKFARNSSLACVRIITVGCVHTHVLLHALMQERPFPSGSREESISRENLTLLTMF